MKADAQHSPDIEYVVSISSLASVLAAVQMAERASHVYALSQASGTLRSPGGHAHHSRFQTRVEPITTSPNSDDCKRHSAARVSPGQSGFDVSSN
jgi:hypothetical protein